jgi:hypothetical protein
MLRSFVMSALAAAVPPRGAMEFADASTDANDSGDAAAAGVAEARARLRDAHAARGRAEDALREASGAVERVRQVIRHAERARDEAEEAERAAAAATRVWAEEGAPADRPASDAALMERAALAARRRDDASTMADGAEAALPTLGRAHDSACIEAERARSEVNEAVRLLLVASVEADFATIDRARAMSADSVRRIHALAHTLRYGKVHAIPAGGAGELERRLTDLALRISRDDELRGGASAWIDYARRLLVDPSAEP